MQIVASPKSFLLTSCSCLVSLPKETSGDTGLTLSSNSAILDSKSIIYFSIISNSSFFVSLFILNPYLNNINGTLEFNNIFDVKLPKIICLNLL